MAATRLPALSRLAWLPLRDGDAWNEAARKAAHDAKGKPRAGVYVVRDRSSKKVLYVGESASGRLWKTLLRHFQDPTGNFAKHAFGGVRGSWTHAHPGKLEVAILPAAEGQGTMDLQARAIAKYKPARNRDAGLAKAKKEEAALAGPWDEEEDYFAQFARENPGKTMPKKRTKKRTATKARAPRGPAHRVRLRRLAGAVVSLRKPNPSHPKTMPVTAPVGALVTLGALTEVEHQHANGAISSWRWSLKSAPTLAYDARGKLFIVYGAKVVGRASKKARAEYERTHWGIPGRGAELEGKILAGTLRVLGTGTRITYTTRKGGDAALVDYVHRWGEGGPSSWEPPWVVCQGERIALAGGTYRVTERGIVG